MSSEVLEELYLAQCSLGQNLLAEHIGNLLDSDTLVGLVVHSGTIAVESRTVSPDPIQRVKECAAAQCSSPDNTIGALTQLFGNRIALVDDKVLVEDLEGLAAL